MTTASTAPTASADGGSASGSRRLFVAVVITGVLTGLAAALLTLLLHGIERLLFGADAATRPDAASVAGPVLRSVTVIVAGTLSGVAWWLLRRGPVPIPSVTQAVAGAPTPVLRVLANAALQVVNVAAGASIGREGAPRETGALAGSRAAGRLGLTARQRQVLVACGAGAGLAAVYDIPLSGVLFVLEVLLVSVAADVVAPAVGTVAIAVVVARIAGVRPGPLYHLEIEPWTGSLVLLALLIGPVLGLAGTGFARLVDTVSARTRRRPALVLVLLPLASIATAAVALPLPLVLGNGQGISLLVLGGGGTLATAALLAVAKAATTAWTLGAGAAGGRLNPSFAIGAAAGTAIGALWAVLLPGAPVSAVALVGAAAFLSAANRSPVTAVALAIEFTGTVGLALPIVLAVAGSALVSALIARDGRRDRTAND